MPETQQTYNIQHIKLSSVPQSGQEEMMLDTKWLRIEKQTHQIADRVSLSKLDFAEFRKCLEKQNRLIHQDYILTEAHISYAVIKAVQTWWNSNPLKLNISRNELVLDCSALNRCGCKEA